MGIGQPDSRLIHFFGGNYFASAASLNWASACPCSASNGALSRRIIASFNRSISRRLIANFISLSFVARQRSLTCLFIFRRVMGSPIIKQFGRTSSGSHVGRLRFFSRPGLFSKVNDMVAARGFGRVFDESIYDATRLLYTAPPRIVRRSALGNKTTFTPLDAEELATTARLSA